MQSMFGEKTRMQEIWPAPLLQKSKENKMDMTIEEYLEFVRSLLEQAEEDGFELE
jgi:hypothetical protein